MIAQIYKDVETVKPHIEKIRKFANAWDDITLDRFKENGLSDEIKWAWWNIVCTNRKLLTEVKRKAA